MLSHSTPITLAFLLFLACFRQDAASGIHCFLGLAGLSPQVFAQMSLRSVRPSLTTRFEKTFLSAPTLYPFSWFIFLQSTYHLTVSFTYFVHYLVFPLGCMLHDDRIFYFFH